MAEASHAVFLSYASQDAEAAQKIAETLVQADPDMNVKNPRTFLRLIGMLHWDAQVDVTNDTHMEYDLKTAGVELWLPRRWNQVATEHGDQA